MDSEDSDQTGRMSLRWAHIPFCWFCHEAAHFRLILRNYELVGGFVGEEEVAPPLHHQYLC